MIVRRLATVVVTTGYMLWVVKGKTLLKSAMR